MADPSPAKGRQLKIGRLVSISVTDGMYVMYIINSTAWCACFLFPVTHFMCKVYTFTYYQVLFLNLVQIHFG